jgi:hypothetical protein
LIACLITLLTVSPVRADNVSRDHGKPYMFYIIIDHADFLQIRSQKSDDDFMQMHLETMHPANVYASNTWDENRLEIALAAGPGNVSPLLQMTPDSNPNCDRAWDKSCHLNFVKGFAVGWFQMNPGDKVHLDYAISNLSHENHDSAEKEFDQIAGDVDTAISWANAATQLSGAQEAEKVVSTVEDVVKEVTDIVNAILDLFGDNKDVSCDGLVFQGYQDLSFDDLLNLNYTPRQQMSLAGSASTDPDRFPVVEGDLATIQDSGGGDPAPSACNGPGQARVTIRVFKSVDPVGPPPPPPPLFGENKQTPTQLVPIAGAPLHAWSGQWVDFPSVGYLGQARVQVQLNDVPAGSSAPSGLLGPPIRRVASLSPAHSLELMKARVRAFHELVVKPPALRAVLGGDPRQAASRRVSFQFSAADLERNNLEAMGVSMTERAPAPGLKVLDSYNANGLRPIAMRATPFSGDVYWQSAFLKGSIGLSSTAQAAVSGVRESNPVSTRLGSGLARGGIPVPARSAYIRHFASLVNPKPLADTVILPNGACLQLYGEYSAGTLFRYRVRYLRTEPNGSTTDVMLFPYMPPPR